MRKKLVVLLLGILLLPWAVFAMATDLPIDIDAIGEMGDEGRDAVTPRFGVDLFSETADEVNTALEEQFEARREASVSGLFSIPTGEPMLGLEEQIIRTADESALFASPMRFGRAGPAVTETAEIPTWVSIVVLAICAVGGFLLARAMMQRKGRDSDVSYLNN